jgi:hypothetical protein
VRAHDAALVAVCLCMSQKEASELGNAIAFARKRLGTDVPELAPLVRVQDALNRRRA